MQTTYSYHMEGLPMAQVAIFKEIFDQVRKDLDCNCLFWTKTSQRLTLYFTIIQVNIHIVKTITPC